MLIRSAFLEPPGFRPREPEAFPQGSPGTNSYYNSHFPVAQKLRIINLDFICHPCDTRARLLQLLTLETSPGFNTCLG